MGIIERIIPVRREGNDILILDQRRLPAEVIYQNVASVAEMEMYIKTLAVRGAPAIGIAGAYGMLIALRGAGSLPDAYDRLDQAAAQLGNARPTAVNLRWAVNRQLSKAKSIRETLEDSHDELKAVEALTCIVREEADAMLSEDMELGRRIGVAGLPLLFNGATVLTHCNAGAIATSGYGTALAPIYIAHENGLKVQVYADETRPLLQGMRLTAWEMAAAGIETTVICDSMAPFAMKQGKIDLVIVGADRIARNGDTANKIGTYGLAVAARAHGISFYIAAPYSTFDPEIPDGSAIPIEERGEEEVVSWRGDRMAPHGVMVYNPAFDVTPAHLISGIITEKGILRAPYETSIADFLK